jgi:tetratricopeptide (TPR) repeat protein
LAQNEIAAQVAAAEKGGTTNPEAHRLYLQGRYYLEVSTLESIDRGAALLQRAVELDPDYAQAWADLSFAGGLINGYGLSKEDVNRGLELSRRAADRALQVAPDLAASYLARSGVQLNDFDWKGAAEALRRAKQLDAGNSDVLWSEAVIALSFGQTAEGIELGSKAAALDPINPVIRVYIGLGLAFQGRFKEARDQYQQVLDLTPASPWGHGGIAVTLLWQGKYAEALPEAAQVSAEWLRLTEVAMAQWGLGRKPESEAALQALITKFADVAAYQIAENYAQRGDRDQAFAWLERAYRQRDPGLERMRVDRCFNAMVPDPRWQTFLHRLGLADDQVSSILL